MINFCVKLCLDMKIYTNFIDGCVRFFVYKSYKKSDNQP